MHQRFTLWLSTLCFAWLLIAKAGAQIDPSLKEDGVLYFYGNLPAPITANVSTAMTVYLHRDFQMALATIYAGQPVELIGMSPEGFLVKTSYRNNTMTGWIRPEDLPAGIDPKLFADAKAAQARHDTVAAAIAAKQVIAGMTPDEVTQAMGKPDQVASRTDTTSSSLSWIFTTYQEVPETSWGYDPFGRRVLQTYYVKEPTGQMTVTFADGVVASIENHQTTGPGVVKN